MANWLLIDVGQTGVRWRSGAEQREVRSDGIGAGGAASVLAMVERAAPRVGPDTAGAVVGLTGDFDDTDRRALTSGLSRALGVGEIRLVHDSVAAYLGALGARAGVVTMCGTGAVTLSWDGAASARRFDGLGPLLGDRGGGATLARDGLRAAMASLDGSGPFTELGVVVEEDWPDAARLVVGLREDDPSARDYARDFTHAVAAAAREGDAVAIGLVEQAARAAAGTTVAAAPASALVSYSGAMFRALEHFLPAWRASVLTRRADLSVVSPMGDALDGAALLATLEPSLLDALGVHLIRAGGAS